MKMQIKISWYGTANYILNINGTRLHFDPFFFRNKDSFPKLTTKKEDIHDIDAIFISHGHFDHVTEAGWLAEKHKVPIYCSETAKTNILKWSKGEIIEGQQYELSQDTIANIKTCNYFNRININPNLTVELIKSEHVKFDVPTIFSRLFSWKFLKKIKSMAHLGRSLEMGKVFGFSIRYQDKFIISFGSLWHEYEDILKKYQNCDLFIAPLAGNSKKNIAKKAGKMIDILKPKYVVPIHWDNFYPPISRLENLSPFFKYTKRNHPETKIIMPIMDDFITIDI